MSGKGKIENLFIPIKGNGAETVIIHKYKMKSNYDFKKQFKLKT